MSMKSIPNNVSLKDEVNTVIEELSLYGYNLEEMGLIEDKVNIEEYILMNMNRDGSAYDFDSVVNSLVMLIEDCAVLEVGLSMSMYEGIGA